jgi:cytoskeletal protein RodZ
VLKINNPFESGHIKNYLLAYASVVVIMILFFIATSLFHDVEQREKKEFDKKAPVKEKKENIDAQVKEDNNSSWKSSIKLMDKSY